MQRLTFGIGPIPGRKKKALVMIDSEKNVTHVLAWFVNEDAAEMFGGIMSQSRVELPVGADIPTMGNA